MFKIKPKYRTPKDFSSESYLLVSPNRRTLVAPDCTQIFRFSMPPVGGRSRPTSLLTCVIMCVASITMRYKLSAFMSFRLERCRWYGGGSDGLRDPRNGSESISSHVSSLSAFAPHYWCFSWFLTRELSVTRSWKRNQLGENGRTDDGSDVAFAHSTEHKCSC